MEPIAPTLLMALAGGTAGAAGQQIWASLRDLVRRGPATGPAGGEGELAALEEVSDSPSRARELSRALAERAEEDPGFARELAAWRRDAEARGGTGTGDGDVHNVISGGTQTTVVQTRDVHGNLHFGG